MSKRLIVTSIFCLSLPLAGLVQATNFNNGYNQPGYSKQTQGYGQQQFEPPTQLITVEAARTGATVILGGTVVPFREISLTAQMAGRVEFLAGAEGDWFEPGELLVAIDDDELVAKRQQAMAELGGHQAALNDAQVQYSREMWAPQSRNIGKMPGMGMPSLFDQFFTRNFGSAMGYGNPMLERQADLYSYGSKMGQAYSQHLGALSRIQEVDARLRDSRGVAPFSGVIIKKQVELGDTVQPGQPLLKYADVRDLQIKVDVPARLMRGLRQDMVVPAMLDVGNAPVNARVAQIFPMADEKRHTVTVKFDLPAEVPGGPGMYAEVMIPDADAPVQKLPVVPESAIVWRGSLPAVFVMNHQSRSELRLIRLGEKVGGNGVTVLSGIRVGERIFASPQPGMSSDWSARRTPVKQ
ncbi:MAG: efflux RND transporter periplasmic adaptor subunit [Gammaproteobacteria bacterium]|nr:efflux RND transporter periplasmic adaptor subunit [Gammaproteobacteria bacterium]